jgi:23S rRNA pseudouridine2605 synthase
MSEKLQKTLARAGMGSRRELERWIGQGRVSVDGRVATVGERVRANQIVRVDGRVVGAGDRRVRRRVLVYHKPEGEICTRRDPAGRPTIFERLPPLRNGRWVAVGRLDINSAGLLLFTTDGELANRLMHPSREIEREYAVRVLGKVDQAIIERLLTGIELPDGWARFESVRVGGGEGANRWFRVTLKEGRKREVRNLWQAVGMKVSRLIRVRYGAIALPRGLRVGHWRELGPRDVAALTAAAGVELPRRAAVAERRRVSRDHARSSERARLRRRSHH